MADQGGSEGERSVGDAVREVVHGAQAESVTEAVAQEGPVPKKTLAISPDLKLPLDAVTQTFAILAMRGVGKTYTASVMAEEFAEAGLPFAVLDPTGAWWGLRSSADGKSDGYPVTILGGDHADAPLEETGGKVIADLLAEEAPPLILDMSRLSKAAMRRFVADFAERLYEKNRNPLHLIIDEADAFAPQKARPDELRMLGALDEIVRRGRIRGLGCTLVTQRSAVLNKDVLTQTEVLVALRTAHPRDRAPVLEWMKVHATEEQLAAVEETLAKLPKGDAWVMSAGWLELFERIHVRERRTFNSSATPEPGQRQVTARKLATVDLAVLQERMAETIEKAKATDPKLLQARIRELEKQVAAEVPPPPPPAPAKEKRVEVPIIKDAQIKRLEQLGARVHDAVLKLNEAGVAIYSTAKHQLPMGRPPEPLPRPEAVRPAQPVRAVAPPRPRPEANGSAEGIGAGERRMLEALGRRHPQPLTRDQLGTLSGFAAGGGTFRNYVAHLKREGLVEERGGSVTLTATGEKEVAHVIGTAQSPDEVRAMWKQSLGAGEWRMVEVLLDQGGEPITREKLGELSGFEASGGTFRNYAAKIKRVGLAVEEHGGIRVVEELLG
jgi:hypothetical protein